MKRGHLAAVAMLACLGVGCEASLNEVTLPPSHPSSMPLAVFEPAPPPAVWSEASRGQVPGGAMPEGVEQPPGGEPLWACRARYASPGKHPGVHPGKVAPHLGGCRIGYGGAEVSVESYEVLVAPVRWMQAWDGGLPDGAYPAGIEGHEDGGERLYLCRARYPEGTTGHHVGKIRPGFQGCSIGWGGNEIGVESYEVAVLDSEPAFRGGKP